MDGPGCVCLTIRERIEKAQRLELSDFAGFADETRGRAHLEEPCSVRTEYQRDRDRILHCKSFRRLKHKTQVFIAKEGDHYRERMTHTLEVTQIARTIARGLQLNEDLTEAIALGHDLGHTPFGHAGERALNGLSRDGFAHNEQSLRVVDVLEKNGQGLNLTWEVRDGILNHRTSLMPATAEGRVVRLADKVAYVNHDIDDAIRSGEIALEDLPGPAVSVLGQSNSQRIGRMVLDVIENSVDMDIMMSDEVDEAMKELREYLFENVYQAGYSANQERKAETIVRQLYRHYSDEKTGPMPDEYERLAAQESRHVAACDYIAGMTDNYAIHMFEKLFIPGRDIAP